MESLVDTVYVSSVNLGKACLQVYNLTTGSCIKSFRGVCASPKSLCPVGLNGYILCGQKDKPLLQAWAINQEEPLQMRFPTPGKLNVMTVSQSRDKLCALGIEEKIFIYDLNTGCQFAYISRHYQDVSSLKFTSCGNYLASAGDDGFVYLWSRFSLLESLHKANRPQVEPHFIFGQHSDKVTDLSICGTGLRGILISCSMDYTAKVFDLVTGHLRHNIVANCGLTASVVNAVGSQVFFAGDKGKVWGMNLLPHTYIQNLQLEGKGTICHESVLRHLALSTTGDLLVTGGADGEVKVWSIVMSERKGTFGEPSLALQNTLLVGRGAITNILIRKFDVEVFQMSPLPLSAVLSPFTNSIDILEANVLHLPPVKDEEEEPFSLSEMHTLASNLLDNSTQKRSKRKKGTTEVIKAREVNETDLLAHVQSLKKSNEELYQFCLKHVLGED